MDDCTEMVPGGRLRRARVTRLTKHSTLKLVFLRISTGLTGLRGEFALAPGFSIRVFPKASAAVTWSVSAG